MIYARHRQRLIVRWDRILGAIGAGIVVAFVAVLAFLIATEEPIPSGNQPAVEQPTLDPTTLPACVTEDSDNCYWDASIRGNGQGTSFYTINDHTVLLP